MLDQDDIYRPRSKGDIIRLVASVCVIVCLSIQDHRSAVRVVIGGQTKGHYQTYYLPCFMVDKKYPSWEFFRQKRKQKGKKPFFQQDVYPYLLITKMFTKHLIIIECY